nr:hypothetical protein KK1_025301 [Cajanus cajan]
MISSLLYLTASKLDIIHNVCICACFQHDPRKSYLKAIKKIFKYLEGTTNLSLFNEKNNNFRLVGFCDIDYVDDRIGRKITSGQYHFLGSCPISWTRKK